MNRLIIRNVLLDEQQADIIIEGNSILSIAPHSSAPFDGEEIDATGLAAFPSFCNTHAHSAMSLFRGYGDDMPLERWLQEKIWPNEANLDAEIVYWGSRLACLEMIKSGTTCFNDMYFFAEETARACEEMGMRATLSLTFFDHFDSQKAEQVKRDLDSYAARVAALPESELVRWAVAPHAVYTVSGPTLQYAAEFAREHNMLYHIHASESKTECANSLRDFGATPVRHLNNLGVLSDKTIIAHGVWLDDEEIRMLGDHGCSVVHNPNSNLKLASGHAFRYNELRDAGANVALGTDGCSSSNNLDMIEATKVMTMLQKGWRLDPVAMPASEALAVATRGGFRALGINAGALQPGMLADLILVDLDNIAFIPNNNTLSNLVYAAHGDCVDTVICNGRPIMRHRIVEGEEEIKSNARRIVKRLITQ
ncbi:MAG: amidohydrolase [Bacteroidales bacterium]|nr:amidohydrolase [Bacteroidales bacterium]